MVTPSLGMRKAPTEWVGAFEDMVVVAKAFQDR
jgi:hypothetical protein